MTAGGENLYSQAERKVGPQRTAKPTAAPIPALQTPGGAGGIDSCTVRLSIPPAPPIIGSASRANGEATAKRRVAHGGAPNAGYIRPVLKIPAIWPLG